MKILRNVEEGEAGNYLFLHEVARQLMMIKCPKILAQLTFVSQATYHTPMLMPTCPNETKFQVIKIRNPQKFIKPGGWGGKELCLDCLLNNNLPNSNN